MIKSEVIEGKAVENINYPCLMRSTNSGAIVLFTDNGVGTVVAVGQKTIGYQETIGYRGIEWVMAYFEPLPIGYKITLENVEDK